VPQLRVDERLLVDGPEKIPDHQLVAVRSAMEIRDRFEQMAAGWRKRGYELGLGMGVAVGFATLGRIGFEGRLDYGAVGNVVILASRLSDTAAPSEILMSQRLNAIVADSIATEPLSDLTLKGFGKPIPVYRVAPANPAGLIKKAARIAASGSLRVGSLGG
jgi:class 3 adenylate cyclase